jgi:hypothetical protein
MSDSIANYRRMLLDQLAAIDRAHRDAAAPILRRLAQIEDLRPPPPIIVPLADLPQHLKDTLK